MILTKPDAIPRLAARAINAWRKWRAGLTLFGENISPETPNDLYFAHLSIYHFFSRFCRDRHVLDLGCGCGYGSAYLRAAGAASVVGVDLDPRNVRYATRRFAGDGVTFRVADAQRLPADLGTFDIVVSSNLFEHLTDVNAALDAISTEFVLAVPPITDAASKAANDAIPYHRSNYYVGEWLDLLRKRFATIDTYAHLAPEGTALDFTSPFASRVDPAAFRFPRAEPEELGGSMTA
ncbi:MAG TPA: class I SAM-dependent methyltransferase, partial [Thermoanaerobaculia bacterium]|nr:class I SAM-dependent methyltransferase [Thermoanaerobaculia bacterium]